MYKKTKVGLNVRHGSGRSFRLHVKINATVFRFIPVSSISYDIGFIPGKIPTMKFSTNTGVQLYRTAGTNGGSLMMEDTTWTSVNDFPPSAENLQLNEAQWDTLLGASHDLLGPQAPGAKGTS